MLRPYTSTGTKSSDDDDDEYVKELESDILAWQNSHIYLTKLVANKSEMHINSL